VELVSVSHSYGPRRVLRDVDLAVAEGEVVVLIGASGSGKSTLLRCIAGLELIEAGEIRIEGVPVQQAVAGKRNRKLLKAARGIRQEVGMVFQDFNLFPHMRVISNVALAPRSVRGMSRADAERAATEYLEHVGMGEYRNSFPTELSGGQKQRVAIARALVKRPQVVLADEPTANLDSATGASILKLMRQVQTESRTTFIFASHDPQLISHADEIFTIRDGEIVEHRTGATP